jgi:hypothetical protein
MSTRPNSRAFQLRRAAERNASFWETPTNQLRQADATFREVLAFEQGADWERRRWMKQRRARDLAYLQPRRGPYA